MTSMEAMDAPSRDHDFPTTLSEIRFANDETKNIYRTLDSLKKSTLSIRNRLDSIVEDAAFVTGVHNRYPTYPLVANERCGSWYIPPHLKSGSAYFKSTDGHYGQWSFSSRRLNLNVLDMVGNNGGMVLVDSTRRGKSIPDALRRTVPIWAAVWNQALFPESGLGLEVCGLEPSETRQIEGRMSRWLTELKELGLDMDTVRKQTRRPMVCRWVVNGAVDLVGRGSDGGGDYNTLVLCSASRIVSGSEMSEDGYIQGAGDDSEGWSGGLTSTIFWTHRELLMSTAEDDLPGLIQDLIKADTSVTCSADPTLIAPTTSLFVAARFTSSPTRSQAERFALVVNCHDDASTGHPHTTSLRCRQGKLGSRDLRDNLSQAREAVHSTLGNDSKSNIMVTCATGADLSVGVALMLLCLFYDDNGQVRNESRQQQVDKQLIKRRLAWITSSIPRANPSRSTLQAVNSFLIGRPS